MVVVEILLVGPLATYFFCFLLRSLFFILGLLRPLL